MKKTKVCIAASAMLIFSSFNTFGQLTVSNGFTATQLAQILAGPNIVINSATLTGSGLASGTFDGTSSNIGMNSGVILSTGEISNAPGPNNSGGGGDNLGQGGTVQMDALAGATSYDAVTLEFSFDVQSDFIQFQYIFASEEYPEYAPPNSSAFNDVFAFYISGPGIVGEENIALVPNTSNPVTINNINAITNNQYYVDNTGGTTVQYDAWTTLLTAEKQGLTPCQEYTMKLVIADAGDAVWNSAVFLLENSFIQGVVDVNTQTVNADNIALEGCIPAQFNFSLDVASATDTQISYQIAGSATNGIDYEFIDTVVTIPAGDTTASIIINSIADALPEGQEEIYIIFQPDQCSAVDTAFLYIDDAQPIEFTLNGTDLSCFGNNTGSIDVNASGGFPPYTYEVTDNSGNGSTTQYSSNPITGLDADTYSVQVYDIYGCKAEALLIGGIFDADTTFLPDGNGVSYDAVLNISGFQAGQTLDNMSQLQQVCATMEHSYLGDLQIKIIAPSGEEVILKEFNGGGSCDLGEPYASGPVDGQNSNLTDPGVGYEYCWNATPNYGTMVGESNNYTHTIPASVGGTYTDNYLPAGAYTSFENLDGLLGAQLNGDWTLEVSDQYNLDNGYIFNWNISLQSDLPDTLVEVTEPNEIEINGFVTQANCGGTDGAIDISVSGDFPPFTYAWSSGQTTEDLSNIGAGTYTVFVTDGNGCTDSVSFNLNNISSINTVANVTDVTCSGGADGAIEITTSGGTAPYSFSWNSGQTTEDINGLMAGTYALTITDDNGCQYTEDIAVNTVPGININLVSSTNEECSFDNGAIDISVSGGSGSYGYSWDNGTATQDLSNIGAGTYTITVTDANLCSAQQSFSIINDVSNCSAFCFTNVAVEEVINENCGDENGSIDLTIMNATPPYVVSWSTGATTDDLTNLNEGVYTITVTDANQCVITQDISVNNDAGNLDVISNSVTNENCGNADGQIDITVAGGTSPYSYLWSNVAITEDVSGLSAGSYSVTITDNNGCEITDSFSINNNTGTLTESVLISNEICGNNGGSINLTVNGGTLPYSYTWNTGSTNQDLSALVAGTYNVTVTDGAGCTLISPDYEVQNTAGDLSLLSTTIVNENCTDGNGSIDISVINGTTPYNFLWSPGGETTEDISGISAGTYSCAITDDNGCSISTGDIIVFNQGGSLSASTNSTTDEVCGDATGQIDIQTIGGTAPYTYLWSNGATTEDIVGLTAGSYSVTITDANGCGYDYVESIQDASPGFSVSVASSSDENCGDQTGAIDIDVVGGTAPLTYAWSNGATTEDIIALEAGVYDVVVTDVNGCSVSTSATIQGAGVSITSATVSDEICGDMAGSIDISFAGGLNPYTFAWTNGATSEDIASLSAGTYDLTITGNNGCTASASYTIGNNTNGLQIVSTTVLDENCGDANGSIDVTTSGGATPLSYNWSNAALTEDLANLTAGTYDLTIEDVNGCSVNTSGTVVNNAAGFTAVISSNTDENCGDGSGSVDVSVTGGTMPYTYSWSSGQTTEDLSNLSAGLYELTVTDASSCSVTLSATVNNQTTGLTIDNAIIGDASCTSANGFIDLTITGGTAPYTFAWDNAATTEDLAGLSAGNYNCVITDASGCELTYSGTVNSNGGNINANPVISNELCGNGEGSIFVTVSGGIAPYTYSWTGGAPSTCCTYTLNMQDQGNSWNGAFITVLVNGISIGDFTVPGGGANVETFQACTGDQIDLVWNAGNFDNEVFFDLLDPSSTIIYSHALGSLPVPGIIFTASANCPTGPNNTTELDDLSEGIYTLTITDNVGCEITESYAIANQASDVQVIIQSVTDEICANNNGEIVYTISGGTAPFATTANGFNDGPPVGILSNLFADDWEIITTDDNGCTDTLIVTIENNATFTTTAVVTDENCSDNSGAIDLTVSGGSSDMSYDWFSGQNTADISGLNEGTYEVIITDNTNGCEDLQTFEVVNMEDISITTSITDEFCSDGSGAIDLTITGSTDVTIGWSNGASTEDIAGLGSGDYTVTIINNTSGCTIEEMFTIEGSTSGMIVDAAVTDENCGNADGEIDITLTGGVGPFSYNWNNGASIQDLNALSAGDYTLTVIDTDDGCSYTETYTVASGGTFNLDVVSVTNESCTGDDGAIDIDLSGPGTFNPTIVWTPGGETTEDLSGLSAGSYSVSVTNFGGCTMTLDVDVALNADINVVSSFGNENCGDGAGFVELTVSGSTDVSYVWAPNGETTEDLIGLSAGTYDVTVTNNTSGCAQDISFIIENTTTGIQLDDMVVANELCGDASASIDITVSGGVGPYSYAWTPNGETTEDISGISAGDYAVVITDDNDGCTLNANASVTNTENFDVTGMITNSSCATCTTGSIDVSINEFISDGPYTFNWTPNGETTEDLTDLTPGTYTVTVTGNSGCQVEVDFTVGNNNDVGLTDKEGWFLEVYPNPTNSSFEINYYFAIDEVLFTMMNSIGQKVIEEIISNEKGKISHSVEELSAGVYYLHFRSAERTQTLRLVITE